MGQIRGFFQIRFSTFGLVEPNVLNLIWKKFPDLSHLGSIWPTLGSNLVTQNQRLKITTLWFKSRCLIGYLVSIVSVFIQRFLFVLLVNLDLDMYVLLLTSFRYVCLSVLPFVYIDTLKSHFLSKKHSQIDILVHFVYSLVAPALKIYFVRIYLFKSNLNVFWEKQNLYHKIMYQVICSKHQNNGLFIIVWKD